jgi:hypothetical protein
LYKEKGIRKQGEAGMVTEDEKYLALLNRNNECMQDSLDEMGDRIRNLHAENCKT